MRRTQECGYKRPGLPGAPLERLTLAALAALCMTATTAEAADIGWGGVELIGWNAAAGAGLGFSGFYSLTLGRRSVVPWTIAGGAVGVAASLPFAGAGEGVAMGVESGQILGAAAGLIPTLSLGANRQTAWTVTTVGALTGGVVGGLTLGDLDPDRHEFVRWSATWGVYLADLSFQIVPSSADTRQVNGFHAIRYTGGAVLTGVTAALLPWTPRRFDTLWVNAAGWTVAIATLPFSSAFVGSPQRVWLQLGIPAVTLAGLGVVAHRSRRASNHRMEGTSLVPTFDPATERAGLRLEVIR